MNAITLTHTARTAPNLFINAKGRTLAYRSIGEGKPVILATRFRGTMDVWDPLFLDELASQGLRVITYDYSGLGLSTGKATYNPAEMAADVFDLIEVLELNEVVVGGWSLGGLVAQVALAMRPDLFSHGVLIGTTPPGPLVKPAEQLFFDTAIIPDYTMREYEILFFEPRSEKSRAAAKRSVDRMFSRNKDRSPPVPLSFAKANLGSGPVDNIFPVDAVTDFLKSTTIPILHLGGDHDIIFPVENWYALNQQFPTVQLITYPSSGHGPQHEYPEASAAHIAAFVKFSA